MIRLTGKDFAAFLAAIQLLDAAGVAVTPSGGNEASIPDDIDTGLLQELAGLDGVEVFTDQPAASTPTTEEPTTISPGDTPAPGKTPRTRKPKER